ncbi:Tyrosine-protein phosphatase non-receptor type substrate 1, partial [Phaethon lepturus]
AQAGRTFELQQPQDKVSVAAGETLTLTCTTSGDGPPGAVKWLKGWGSGNETVYDQTGSFPRVTRAVAESNTDFSIHIRDVRPEDAGTYYCVKFRKSLSGADEVFRRGNGTEVSLHGECSPVGRCSRGPHPTAPTLPARGPALPRAHHPLPILPLAMGSLSPIPLRCCAGTPRFVPTTSSFCTSKLPYPPALSCSKEDDDIHYADLQPLPVAPRHSRSPGAACSEYASIRVAAK